MAETNVAPAATQEKTGQIVEAGKPTPGVFPINVNGSQQQASGEAPVELTDEQKAAAQETPESKAAREAASKIPELSDDQLKEILKGKGISFDDFDSLKKKVEYTPPTLALSAEDQKKAEIELEKKLFELHTKRGGTLEQFAAFKTVQSTDPKILGIDKIKSDLIQDGFQPDEVDNLIKKMHLNVSDEELAEMEEADRKKIEKERAFGEKKLQNRGLYLQNTAKSYFDSLKQELQELDAEKVKMEQHTAKAVDAIKNYQRKQTLQLGERDGVQLSPVEFDVQDEVLNEVLEIVKDPVKLEQHLYTKEGDLNLDFLIPHLVNSVSREKVAKVAFFSGETKAIEHIEATYGSNPPPLGANGRQQGQSGKIVSTGKPQVGRPSFQK
jgi:hypothetical protein